MWKQINVLAAVKRLLVAHYYEAYIFWFFVIIEPIKGSIFLKNKHFIILERCNKLIYMVLIQSQNVTPDSL